MDIMIYVVKASKITFSIMLGALPSENLKKRKCCLKVPDDGIQKNRI